MGGTQDSSNSRYRDHLFGWGREFMTRRGKAYAAEEHNLVPESNDSSLKTFLCAQRSRLDPPDHNFPELQEFLEKAQDIELIEESSFPQYDVPIALLDDRRDTTGWQDSRGEHFSARDWDGYASYPPQGENRFESLLSAGNLYRRLMTSVGLMTCNPWDVANPIIQRRATGAERRIM